MIPFRSILSVMTSDLSEVSMYRKFPHDGLASTISESSSSLSLFIISTDLRMCSKSLNAAIPAATAGVVTPKKGGAAFL
jgi:hypothetical protein